MCRSFLHLKIIRLVTEDAVNDLCDFLYNHLESIAGCQQERDWLQSYFRAFLATYLMQSDDVQMADSDSVTSDSHKLEGRDLEKMVLKRQKSIKSDIKQS